MMLQYKSIMDYIIEMNKLLPKINENEPLPNAYGQPNMSPYSQTAMGNRSSSSADSTSPESYNADVATPPRWGYHQDTLTPDSPMPAYASERANTPFLARGQRPIVGRKIFTPVEHLPVNYEAPMTVAPPNNRFNHMNRKVPIQSAPNGFRDMTPSFYELFPTENKGYEFKSPVKTAPTLASPNASFNMSYSPMASPPTYNISPNRPVSPAYAPFSPHKFADNMPLYQPSTPPNQLLRYQNEIPPQRMCSFCRKNGETPIVYMTHSVKEKEGNRHIVTCPILRSHICSTCGATGDNAHTITYCPVLRRSNNGRPIPSTTITLKSTRVKSNGRRRF